MQKQTSLDSFFFTQIASYHTLPSDTILISVKLQPNCNHDFEGTLQPGKLEKSGAIATHCKNSLCTVLRTNCRQRHCRAASAGPDSGIRFMDVESVYTLRETRFNGRVSNCRYLVGFRLDKWISRCIFHVDSAGSVGRIRRG